MENLNFLNLLILSGLFLNLNSMEIPKESNNKVKIDAVNADYSNLPDNMILEIVYQILNKKPDYIPDTSIKDSKGNPITPEVVNPIKDAVNFLSTNKRFIRLRNELLNSDVKQISGIKDKLAKIIKDFKFLEQKYKKELYKNNWQGIPYYILNAIQEGLPEIVKFYLPYQSDEDKKNILNYLISSYEFNPKIKSNNLEFIEILIKNGTKLEEVYSYLTISSYSSSPELAELLMRYGARLTEKNKESFKFNNYNKELKLYESYLEKLDAKNSGKEEVKK